MRWIDDHGYCRWYTVMAKAMNQAQRGLVLEFGCGEGRTTRELAEMAGPNMVYAFDSFQGLPEAWGSQHQKGGCHFPKPTNLPGNVSIVAGWFKDTLPQWMFDHPGSVSFLHIDCDLYSSTKYVLQSLAGRLDGAMIAFDEIEGQLLYQDHEGRAFKEFLEEEAFTATRFAKQHTDGAVYRVRKVYAA